MVEPEPVETVYPEDTFELEDYSPSIELLKDAGILSEIEERPIIESLKPVSSNQHSKSKLQDIVKKLITVRNAQESEDEKNPLLLEPIRQTSRAMFQVSTYPHYSKSQIFVKKFNFEKLSTFSRVFQPYFFLTIFLVKSKLSTAKKSKTTTFSRVFHPKNRRFSREIKVEFLDKK